MDNIKALGMIEVCGRVGAVEALDAALKAADTELLSLVRVGGGITTILIEGEVAAVKASVEAGGAAADRVGDLRATHVIPRPDPSVRLMIEADTIGHYDGEDFPYIGEDNYPAPEQESAAQTPAGPAAAEPSAPAAAEVKKAVKPAPAPKKAADPGQTDLSGMTVSQLRALARETEGFPMSRQEIKYAKKDALRAAFEEMGRR
ncbi:MAG: BMC domain-containing protein [Lachnospiraceae bacterium]|nr:BMC domain-containing protein [Lachnospiraceae bacterium]